MMTEEQRNNMAANLVDFLLDLEAKAERDSDPISIDGLTGDGRVVGAIVLIRGARDSDGPAVHRVRGHPAAIVRHGVRGSTNQPRAVRCDGRSGKVRRQAMSNYTIRIPSGAITYTSVGYTIARCERSGNPPNTDTVPVGKPCTCKACTVDRCARGTPFVVDAKDLAQRVGAYAYPLESVGPVQSGTLREVKPRGER